MARNFDRGDHARGDAASPEDWLYRLDRLDTLRFVISATPDLTLRLRPNDQAAVSFGEFPGREFPARVAHASRVFDSASGTMRMELLLENKDLAIPAGLTGSATFKLSPAQGTYIVPTNALIIRQGKTIVATVEDGKVHFMDLLPGRNFGRDVEVVSGRLSDTTSVILNPNAMLREGMRLPRLRSRPRSEGDIRPKNRPTRVVPPPSSGPNHRTNLTRERKDARDAERIHQSGNAPAESSI